MPLTSLRLGVLCPNSTAPFLSADLTVAASVIKSGYTITMAPANLAVAGPLDCNRAVSTTADYATGIPLSLGTSGNRAFATNTVGTVWQDQDGSGAPAEPFVIAGDVKPIQ